MKLAIPFIGLALLVAAGCQQTPPAQPTANAIDVTTPVAPPGVSMAPTPVPVADTTATPAINASQSAPGNSYTIKPGDTLWKIAATHYGDGKKWQQIVSANPGLTPSKLRIGQNITLP